MVAGMPYVAVQLCVLLLLPFPWLLRSPCPSQDVTLELSVRVASPRWVKEACGYSGSHRHGSILHVCLAKGNVIAGRELRPCARAVWSLLIPCHAVLNVTVGGAFPFSHCSLSVGGAWTTSGRHSSTGMRWLVASLYSWLGILHILLHDWVVGGLLWTLVQLLYTCLLRVRSFL